MIDPQDDAHATLFVLAYRGQAETHEGEGPQAAATLEARPCGAGRGRCLRPTVPSESESESRSPTVTSTYIVTYELGRGARSEARDMLALLYYYGSVSVQYLYLLSVSRAHATSHRFWMLRTLYIAVLRHGGSRGPPAPSCHSAIVGNRASRY